MTQYIGDVPVSSIQEVSISKAEETDEIDIIDEDTNIILSSSDEGKVIEIDFTLLEQTHPERLNVEKQRSETKELVSNDVSDNYFQYNKTKYFLSVEDVSVSEDASVQNIRGGTVNAKAFSWPKNFRGGRTGSDKLNSGEVTYTLFIDGDVSTASEFTEGHLILSFNIVSSPSKEISSESEIEYSFILGQEKIGTFGRQFGRSFGTEKTVLTMNVELSSESELNYRLNFEDILADMKWSSVGCLQFILNHDGELSLQIHLSGSINYSLDLEGELEPDFGGRFGRTFGRTFGGS